MIELVSLVCHRAGYDAQSGVTTGSVWICDVQFCQKLACEDRAQSQHGWWQCRVLHFENHWGRELRARASATWSSDITIPLCRKQRSVLVAHNGKTEDTLIEEQNFFSTNILIS